jgi:chemotaxis protein methyltransferase CheR
MARDLERDLEGDNERQSEAIEVRLLLEGIYARYGYDLRGYADASMQRRVRAVLARMGIERVSELQHRVLREPETFSYVLGSLAVCVTELFRDPDQYRLLRERVIPVLRTYPLLKIWLAGCASGEEAYSMAMLLTEEGLYERTQIYATDLNAEALERAKAGVYSIEALPAFQDGFQRAGGTSDISRYCTVAYDAIAMSDALRRNILFFQHDLVSDHAFGEMNVIFCRNVFIYFGAELRTRVLDKLAESLRSGGYLCLGRSERIGRSQHEQSFEQLTASEAIYRYTAQR